MAFLSLCTNRFGYFQIVNVIPKTTSRDICGGKFKTLIANIYIIVQQYLSMNNIGDYNINSYCCSKICTYIIEIK